jgi:DNA-binding Lrp family transcriptional regulator
LFYEITILNLTKDTVPFICLLFLYNMLRAYLLIICDLEHKYEITNYFKKLDNVINVDITSGPYDIVVEIIFETMNDLKEKVENNITNIDNSISTSTLTLIRSEDIK